MSGTPAVAVSGIYGREPAGGVCNSSLPAPPGQTPGGVGRYLDIIANVSFEAKIALHKLGDDLNSALLPTCQDRAWFVTGECANGHRFAKELVCGKEFCPVCGEDGSTAHNRRFARWLPKIQHFESLGYFVFTIPEAQRAKYKTKKALADLGHQVQELLKSWGYLRGLRRWHFFGDYAGLIGGREVNLGELRISYLKAFNRLIETFAKMNGFDLVLNPNKATIFWRNPGGQHSSVIARLVADFAKTYGLHLKPYSSIKPNPHLNSLVGGECGPYIPPRVLATIKLEYAGLVYGIPVKELGESHPIDVKYRYRLSPGKMVHALKYVTRATFRDYTWDLDMAMELRGFRNMVVWGRGEWGDEPAWSLGDLGGKARAAVEDLDIRAIESIVAGVCPVCGEALTWGEALPIGLLDMVDKQSLGAGYYSLGDLPPPPVQPADVKFRLYALELAHRVEVRQSVARAEAEARAEAGEYQGWWSGLLDTD